MLIDTLSLIFIHLKLTSNKRILGVIVKSHKNLLAVLDSANSNVKIILLKCLIMTNIYQKDLLNKDIFESICRFL